MKNIIYYQYTTGDFFIDCPDKTILDRPVESILLGTFKDSEMNKILKNKDRSLCVFAYSDCYDNYHYANIGKSYGKQWEIIAHSIDEHLAHRFVSMQDRKDISIKQNRSKEVSLEFKSFISNENLLRDIILTECFFGKYC